MRGKYANWLIYSLALVRRKRLRSKLKDLMSWEPLSQPVPGCTAIVGMCSRLPNLLIVNLRCLWMARWPDLKEVIVVVDGLKTPLLDGLAETVTTHYPELNIRFLYYSAAHAASTDSLSRPYVYSWLSWCIALKHTNTACVLLHDYDALAMGHSLHERYKAFVESGVKVQGVAWYRNNGVLQQDRLATTFEAFFDTQWVRSLRPIDLFNNVGLVKGRSVDFDTTLDSQLRLLATEDRAILPMTSEELVHPSQMIHQFTMFRRYPGASLPCFSIPMIPVFSYLSGFAEGLDHATETLRTSARDRIDLLGDGTQINLSTFDVAQVDWLLKQSVQACMGLAVAPDPRLYKYGEALYRVIGAAADAVWRGDFTPPQREWIGAAARSIATPHSLIA